MSLFMQDTFFKNFDIIKKYFYWAPDLCYNTGRSFLNGEFTIQVQHMPEMVIKKGFIAKVKEVLRIPEKLYLDLQALKN